MRKICTISALLFVLASTSSCWVNRFDVGKGAQSNVKVRQWNHYLIGGLIPVGQSDPKQMAAGAKDYTVTIKHSFVNLLVSYVTGGIYAPTTTIVKK
jgi:Bor protein